MSTSIRLKKSAIPGRAPGSGDLEYGELAINYADGVIYFKNTSNTIQSIVASPSGVDSNAVANLIDSAYVQSKINKTFINNLDVNAGTLDGQDGTYFLDYNNFTNTPSIPDSAFVSGIASTTVSPADSDQIKSAVDSAFIQSLVKEDYVATIVDSAYVALRVGDFAENFGTVAVVGDLSINATTGGDTITFAAGNGVQISTDVANKRVTIGANTTQAFDFGTFSAPVTFSLDMGAI
jgi:hypothetical protein